MKRRPHIEAVLRGAVDVLDGTVRYPDGTARRACMTFSPHRRDGRVIGFFVTTIDLDLIGEHVSVRDLHEDLVAAVSEHLAEPSTAGAEASIQALLDSIKGLLVEVRRRLGTA